MTRYRLMHFERLDGNDGDARYALTVKMISPSLVKSLLGFGSDREVEACYEGTRGEWKDSSSGKRVTGRLACRLDHYFSVSLREQRQ